MLNGVRLVSLIRYKNNPKLVKAVVSGLKEFIDDFQRNDDELMQYWDSHHEQFEFKVWSKEIAQMVREM